MNLQHLSKETISKTYNIKWFSVHFPKEYEYVISWCQSSNLTELKFTAKIWHVYHQIPNIPRCYCNNILTFINVTKGYHKYCSKKCQVNSNETVEKRKKTCLKKHGVENAAQSEIIKNKMKKTCLKKYGVENASSFDLIKEKKKETCLKNFGTEYPTQSKKVIEKRIDNSLKKYNIEHFTQSEKFKEKFKETCLTKYKVEHFFKDQNVQDKIKNTMLKKYGVENISQTSHFKEKIFNKKNEFWKNKIEQDFPDFIFNKMIQSSVLEISCPNNHIFNINSNQYNLRRVNKHELCTICNPIINNHNSEFQKDVTDFISSIYFKKIEIEFKLDRKELDIYLPDLKIAIECNGIYWHSELYKDRYYHFDKFKKCYDNEIKLIQIWEDDWLYKNEIVKSRIVNLLHESKRIYARNCKIKFIDNNTASDFLNQNHLHGKNNSSINIGLYYNETLVSVMTFGKLRHFMSSSDEKGVYELYRLCHKNGYNITGGTQKMLKFFKDNFQFKKIVTYQDLDWGFSDFYQKLGMNFIRFTGPGYWYLINDHKEHRYNWNKSKLIKMGHDLNLSEKDIMLNLGYHRIWNSGNAYYELTI